jgi:hypothetical protein
MHTERKAPQIVIFWYSKNLVLIYLVSIIVDTLYFQADLVWNNNLGGIFVWTIDMDDFSGSCGMKYPMMNAVLHGLHAYHDYLIEKNEVMVFRSHNFIFLY